MSEPVCRTERGYVGGTDERDWLSRHCEGDAEAFPRLLRQYRRPVYGYLVRCGLDAASCDDVFQDIFLKIHAGAGSYDAAQPLRAWIFTIAANTVRNHWRRSKAGLAVVSNEPLRDHGDPGPGTDGIAETGQTLAWLPAAIAGLPLAHREVLILVAIEGLPQQEVAAILGIPLNSVKTNLRRARLALLEEQRRRDAPVNAGEHS